MDPPVFSKKAIETTMRVTRQTAKGAPVARAEKYQRKAIKRKRKVTENEISTTATNGDQVEAPENDEEERSPDKVRKLSGEGEEATDSEEDMEQSEDQDQDHDQEMSEQEEEEESEESSSHNRVVLGASGEPRAVNRNEFSKSDSYRTTLQPPTYLRSRRSIHMENKGNEDIEDRPQRTTENMYGRGLHHTEALKARNSIRQYKTEEKELPRATHPTWNRYPLPKPIVPIPGKQCVIPKVYQANSVPLQKPTPKGGKKELGGQTILKAKSHSSCEGWLWKLCLLGLILVGVILLFPLMKERVRQHESVADAHTKGFVAKFFDVESRFPSQRAELWKRSKIHLERHLQTAQPTEPVSIILTSGRMAERTLHCLASHMAAAFSSAHNASVLHIDGVSEAHLDSDQAKLDIDEKLRGAFEGDKMAAVIHRFEELPPGSTLIFYRYCDHENAAYKNVFLVFTVLLPKDELSTELSLKALEEMVQDYLQSRFLSSSQLASFNHMDIDKLSGLWSRISHLILPVEAEESIEQQGCTM